MFRTAAQLADAFRTEAVTTLNFAALEGAALRGELGRAAQDVALASWAAEYRELKAAGQIEEAGRIRAMVFNLVPMD